MDREKNVIEARDLLQAKKIELIDVRSKEQFEKKNIEGSVNIPLSLISQKMENLDTKTVYLLICNDGALSNQALKIFEACQFKAYIVRGGLKDWKRVIGL